MYSGSQTSSKDMNLLFQSSTFKNSSEVVGGGGGGDFQRNNNNRGGGGEVSMDVNLFHRRQQNQQVHHHQNQNQQQLNSGLMRYRSAPSSLFANLINGDDDDDEGEGCDTFIPPPHSSPEAETIFARFMSSCAGNDSDLREMSDKSTPIINRNPQFIASMEQESEDQKGFPPPPPPTQMVFHSPPPPPPPQQHQQQQPPPSQTSLQNQCSSNPTEGSYRVVNSMTMDQQNSSQLKMGGSGNTTTNSSNLIRHSSSPAGLFSHLSVENGYAVMRGIGNFGGGNGMNGEATPPTSRLKSQLSFPSRPPTSSGLMSQISEIESDSIEGGNNGEDGSLGDGNSRFIPGFAQATWNDSGLDSFSSLKRARDISHNMNSGLNPSETQNGEAGHHTTTGLTHHYSLPANPAEMAAILQFQDSVPCKIRAKRGCATHPRSIAERVRRTRISERMRKLQELVPNMDKQTNTADMLDLAVEYIKDLQKQVKTMNENRANCTCSSKQKL